MAAKFTSEFKQFDRAELDRQEQITYDVLLSGTDEGREQALARYRQILEEVNALMPRYFRVVPTQKLLARTMPVAAGQGSAELKLLELRERAKAALGPNFNLRDFHSAILGNGALPLTLL
jgi:uncharacterized protein (DUF885 family)